MKKLLRKSINLVFIVFALNQTAFAQSDMSQVLKGSINDANKLAQAYINPLLGGMCASLNNGWYNTAKPHGLGGFDITSTFNFIQLNSEMKTFDPSAIGLSTKNGSNPYFDLNGATSSPTVYGSKTAGSKVDVRQQFDPNIAATDTVIASFNLPKGTGAPFGLGLPTIQLAVGIVKKTEIMVRFVPNITSGDFKINMLGFGVKHDLSQWFWGVDKVPVDISGIFAFNTLKSTYALGDDYLKPEGNYPGAKSDETYKSSQQLDFKGNGFMLGAIISKKLLFFTPYAGVNYTANKIDFNMNGIYPITLVETNTSDPNFGNKKIVNLEDPITLNRSVNFVRATVGMRFHLGFVTFSGEYNLGEINTISLGAGINIQAIAPFKLM